MGLGLGLGLPARSSGRARVRGRVRARGRVRGRARGRDRARVTCSIEWKSRAICPQYLVRVRGRVGFRVRYWGLGTALGSGLASP